LRPQPELEQVLIHSELRSSCLDDIYHFERLKICLPGDVDPTTLTPQQKEHFEGIYNNCRKKARKVFKAMVKDRFEEELMDLLKQTIEDCLPQKPEQMHWENIMKHQQNRLTEIYFACWDRGFTKSTIKKYFRKYLLTGVDDFDILNEPYVPEHTTVLHPTEEHQMMKEWIEGKLAEKGFISRSEDFDEFHELFGYAKRTFSKKLGLFGLKFNGKKWIMEMRTRE
ncbi:MAG: hypothetical protein KAU14_00820, partial [Thermoplasmata archaeon]|nr:hypothetical protein [Thermoplasmata archaeon]